MDALAVALYSTLIVAATVVSLRFASVLSASARVKLARANADLAQTAAQRDAELLRHQRMQAIGTLGGRPRKDRAGDDQDDEDEDDEEDDDENTYTIHPLLEQVLLGADVDIQGALQGDRRELVKVFAMKDKLLAELKRVWSGTAGAGQNGSANNLEGPVDPEWARTFGNLPYT